MFAHSFLLMGVISSCFVNINSELCPFGFVRHGPSCYWFSTYRSSFSEARSMCSYFGSKLIKIENKEEDDYIRGQAMVRGTVQTYLLGGTDLLKEGNWTWEGDRNEMIYTNWYPGEPSNTKNKEHCLGMKRASGNYKWNDVPCEVAYNFICERPVAALTRLVPGPGRGRLEMNRNGVWGTVCDDGFSNFEAKVVCRSLGFSTAIAKIVPAAQITDGSGAIWLDDVRCSGIESSLVNCAHGAWGVHNCGHPEDIGVQC